LNFGSFRIRSPDPVHDVLAEVWVSAIVYFWTCADRLSCSWQIFALLC